MIKPNLTYVTYIIHVNHFTPHENSIKLFWTRGAVDIAKCEEVVTDSVYDAVTLNPALTIRRGIAVYSLPLK